MTVLIVGNSQKIKRVVFDMRSFDLAFSNRNGDVGLPIGITMEISGASSVGKSTTTYGIAGMVASELRTDISLADFEGFDPVFLTTTLESVGFNGKVNYIQASEDEIALDALILSLQGIKISKNGKHLKDLEANYGVGILDSVGAISPLSEAEGELGEANWGKRAKLMAQFMRKATKVSRGTSKTFFLINHQHPNMGARGVNTPGGETIKYLSAVRIRMSRKEEFPDKSYIIEGKVIKNRFGYKDTIFHLVNLSGKGIHQGLTWMYDGFLQKDGLVTRSSAGIKIDGQHICRLHEAFKQAHEGNNDFFLPFRDAVYKVSASPETLVEQEEEFHGETDADREKEKVEDD